MKLPGFVNGSYENQSRVMAGERAINLMPEVVDSGGKVRSALVPTPGFADFASTLDSPGRGIFEEFGRCFAVFGDTLYEIDVNGLPPHVGQWSSTPIRCRCRRTATVAASSSSCQAAAGTS